MLVHGVRRLRDAERLGHLRLRPGGRLRRRPELGRAAAHSVLGSDEPLGKLLIGLGFVTEAEFDRIYESK